MRHNNNLPKWRVDLDQLTQKQLARYEDSLEVLSLLRHGVTIRKASQMLGISVPTTRKYVGPALRIKNKRITARKNDSLLRKMSIYEDGKQVFIQVRGKKKAFLIGKYHSAIGKLLEQNDATALEQ